MKTSELTGAALDWAVAKADNNGHAMDGIRELLMNRFSPSANWAQGGPIIERERIRLEPMYQDSGWLSFSSDEFDPSNRVGFGPTPLVAAMRCYVASKLGDEVEIPDELL